jgi:thiamine biosynthesis lipoprotein ApbE
MMTADETDVRNLQKQIDQIFKNVEIQSDTLLAVSELSKLNEFIELNRLRRFNEFFKLSNHHVENTQSKR